MPFSPGLSASMVRLPQSILKEWTQWFSLNVSQVQSLSCSEPSGASHCPENNTLMASMAQVTLQTSGASFSLGSQTPVLQHRSSCLWLAPVHPSDLVAASPSREAFPDPQPHPVILQAHSVFMSLPLSLDSKFHEGSNQTCLVSYSVSNSYRIIEGWWRLLTKQMKYWESKPGEAASLLTGQKSHIYRLLPLTSSPFTKRLEFCHQETSQRKGRTSEHSQHCPAIGRWLRQMHVLVRGDEWHTTPFKKFLISPRFAPSCLPQDVMSCRPQVPCLHSS